MQLSSRNNFFIITGAPGVGKSTLISCLARTHSVEMEPARSVIAEQRSINGDGVWDKDRKKFVELLLEKSINQFLNNNQSRPVFFDRGIPDCLAYASYGGLETQAFVLAAQQYRYNKKVFLLSPWEEIYTTDLERNMKFSEVLVFHDHIVSFYNQFGYQLVLVPNLGLEDRVNFILKALGE